MRLIHIVGTRPNFIKVEPVMDACADRVGFEQVLIQTGQHYDEYMSDFFSSAWLAGA